MTLNTSEEEQKTRTKSKYLPAQISRPKILSPETQNQRGEPSLKAQRDRPSSIAMEAKRESINLKRGKKFREPFLASTETPTSNELREWMALTNSLDSFVAAKEEWLGVKILVWGISGFYFFALSSKFGAKFLLLFLVMEGRRFMSNFARQSCGRDKYV